ncbi:MAG: ABC transporter ATP-binding protein [candidate division KSB1 bacterium]|nr:ABC transporter ATP-binding protein [candidate division KSB1 bacterium]
MIKLENVSKTFENVRAVVSLNLWINRELFVFLGPNGAGKTTTIKMMTGLLRPDAGRIEINGIDIVREPLRAKQQFGFVPENPVLYEKLTPHEFLEFIIKAYGVPMDRGLERMNRLLDIFELTDFRDELIENLSGGMKKKVSLIAALVHQPKVLFLDEPTVSLDPKATRNLKDILNGLIQKGTTIFMSTHILEIAEAMCDRIGIINQGELVALGGPDHIRQQSGSPETLESVFLELTGNVSKAKVAEFLKDD